MLRTANFRLSGQKLFLDFKFPFKITAEAEPRQRRGEATIAQNPNLENWRYLLVKIRTFFDENPDCEFWTLRPAAARFARCPAKKFSSHFLICARPIFSSKRKRKLFCWPLLWTSRAAGRRLGSGWQKGRGLGGRNFCPPSLSPLLFSLPQFFVFRFAKCAARKEVVFAPPTRAHTTILLPLFTICHFWCSIKVVERKYNLIL